MDTCLEVRPWNVFFSSNLSCPCFQQLDVECEVRSSLFLNEVYQVQFNFRIHSSLRPPATYFCFAGCCIQRGLPFASSNHECGARSHLQHGCQWFSAATITFSLKVAEYCFRGPDIAQSLAVAKSVWLKWGLKMAQEPDDDSADQCRNRNCELGLKIVEVRIYIV